MNEIIDISVSLRPDMPIWPGSAGYTLAPTQRIENGDPANVSMLKCDVHVGTHIDAPFHFLCDGSAVEQIELDFLIGPAVVANIENRASIGADDLNALGLDGGVKRLLLQTDNSRLWRRGEKKFHEDFVALTLDAAQWVAQRGIKTIGIDYLSVQRYRDDARTHQVLLQAGVVILEGLNLAAVEPGEYELLCLPLKLVGSDGAPARAVLRRASGV